MANLVIKHLENELTVATKIFIHYLNITKQYKYNLSILYKIDRSSK